MWLQGLIGGIQDQLIWVMFIMPPEIIITLLNITIQDLKLIYHYIPDPSVVEENNQGFLKFGGIVISLVLITPFLIIVPSFSFFLMISDFTFW